MLLADPRQRLGRVDEVYAALDDAAQGSYGAGAVGGVGPRCPGR